jgi:E3 ubiquitin-protein ligase RNF14
MLDFMWLIDLFRHGAHTSCPIDSVEKLVADYMALPGDSPIREMMERQYGKGVIAKLVAKYEEERKNLAWITASTMACPGCQVNVEKSRGCNHVRNVFYICDITPDMMMSRDRR